MSRITPAQRAQAIEALAAMAGQLGQIGDWLTAADDGDDRAADVLDCAERDLSAACWMIGAPVRQAVRRAG